MQRLIRLAAMLTWTACASAFALAEDPASQKVTVDFRWIEPQFIDGVTEKNGHPIVCGGEDWYAHLKPVLTSEFIADASLSSVRITSEIQYAVNFRLTAEALDKLIEASGDQSDRRLTVCVNGRWYGSTHFNKDTARVTGFHVPTAGFMASKSLAERILQAVN